MEIRSKMKHGTATFADTAEYNDRTSSILGSVLSGRMPSTPDGERAKLCEYLLRHLYDDTNEMCAAVQQTLDKANGIQIAPQKAPFPAERVQAISGSLEDKTVPMETIQRRAGSAATVGRAFHDAYMKENAKFRTKAGLKCYITRSGGAKCCDWCAEVAGKYEYSAAPEGVFRRHDNCSCTVYYDTNRTRQTLQGKLDAEGNRTKTWEVIDEVPHGFAPTVFTDETRPQGFVPTVLTSSAKSGTIRLTDSDDFWHPITEQSIQSVPQVSAFSDDLNTAVQDRCRELLSSLIEDEIGTEGTVSIRLHDLTAEIAKGASGEGGVKPIHLSEPYVSIHNHPSDETFSALDLRLLCIDDQCSAIIVVGNSGENIFVLQKTDTFDPDGMMRYIRDRIDGAISDATLEGFVKGSEEYGTKYHK